VRAHGRVGARGHVDGQGEAEGLAVHLEAELRALARPRRHAQLHQQHALVRTRARRRAAGGRAAVGRSAARRPLRPARPRVGPGGLARGTGRVGEPSRARVRAHLRRQLVHVRHHQPPKLAVGGGVVGVGVVGGGRVCRRRLRGPRGDRERVVLRDGERGRAHRELAVEQLQRLQPRLEGLVPTQRRRRARAAALGESSGERRRAVVGGAAAARGRARSGEGRRAGRRARAVAPAAAHRAQPLGLLRVAGRAARLGGVRGRRRRRPKLLGLARGRLGQPAGGRVDAADAGVRKERRDLFNVRRQIIALVRRRREGRRGRDVARRRARRRPMLAVRAVAVERAPPALLAQVAAVVAELGQVAPHVHQRAVLAPVARVEVLVERAEARACLPRLLRDAPALGDLGRAAKRAVRVVLGLRDLVAHMHVHVRHAAQTLAPQPAAGLCAHVPAAGLFHCFAAEIKPGLRPD
jgi:hypothetical protein